MLYLYLIKIISSARSATQHVLCGTKMLMIHACCLRMQSLMHAMLKGILRLLRGPVVEQCCWCGKGWAAAAG